MNPGIRISSCLWVYALMSLLLPCSAWAEETEAAVKKIIIVPFTINAQKDLSFLRNGIADMFASRLTSEASEIISREQTLAALGSVDAPLTEGNARKLGTHLGAQYVLFGSLTVFGNAVSIDAKMVDVAGQDRPFEFFTQTGSMGEVIPEIDGFAEEINRKIFGREMVRATPAVPAAPAAARTEPAPAGVRAHPEKLLRQPGGQYGRPGVNAPPWQTEKSADRLPNPAFSSGAPTGGHSFWRSRNFDRRIDGLALGDVNGDGRTDIVIVEEHAVHLYYFHDGRLQKSAQLGQDKGKFYVSADAADINGNGIPEPFLSGLSELKRGFESSVYEFDGQIFKPIVENARWLYRTTNARGAVPLLLGQQYRGENPYDGEIYTLRWDGGDYVTERLIIGKKKANVLGAAYGDLLAEERNNAVAYSESDVIRAFSSTGKIGPTTDNGYGGSMIDITVPTTGDGMVRQFRFLPARLLIDDVDGDGRQELITIRNKDMAGKMFESMRKFSKGQLVAIAWDGMALNETWATPKLSSYISDFAIGDLDGDGKRDLVASVVIESGQAIFSKPISHLIAYPLDSQN